MPGSPGPGADTINWGQPAPPPPYGNDRADDYADDYAEDGGGAEEREQRSYLRAGVGMSLGGAAVAGALTAALVVGVHADRMPFLAIVAVMQVLFAVAWFVVANPAGRIAVMVVGLAAGGACDAVAVLTDEASIAAFAPVIGVAFVVAILAQLTRGVARVQVTESMGSTLALVVGQAALATAVVLQRTPGGREVLTACVLAGGAGLVLARLADLALPRPQVAPDVGRGAIGVVIGSMSGTALAAAAGSLLDPLSPLYAGLVGAGVALATVLADLGVAYGEAGRVKAGEKTSRSPLRVALGPLVGLAVATPAAYVLGLLLLL